MKTRLNNEQDKRERKKDFTNTLNSTGEERVRRRVTQKASSLFFSYSEISFQNLTRGAGTRVGGLFLNRQFFFFFKCIMWERGTQNIKPESPIRG